MIELTFACDPLMCQRWALLVLDSLNDLGLLSGSTSRRAHCPHA